jgi:hypothetical protein
MDCFVCKGMDSMEDKLAGFCACDSPTASLVENMPGFVCRLRRNKELSGKAIEGLEAIKDGEIQPTNWQAVATFDLGE